MGYFDNPSLFPNGSGAGAGAGTNTGNTSTGNTSTGNTSTENTPKKGLSKFRILIIVLSVGLVITVSYLLLSKVKT